MGVSGPEHMRFRATPASALCVRGAEYIKKDKRRMKEENYYVRSSLWISTPPIARPRPSASETNVIADVPPAHARCTLKSKKKKSVSER